MFKPMTPFVALNHDVSLFCRFMTCETDDTRTGMIRETFILRRLLCLAYIAVIGCVLAITGWPGPDWHWGVVAAVPLLIVSVNQGA